jgi:hypothetical protein
MVEKFFHRRDAEARREQQQRIAGIEHSYLGSFEFWLIGKFSSLRLGVSAVP